MNYTKIYAAVAKKKTIYVWQPNESDQWLIVDGAIYSVSGLPDLNCENVLPLIGVDSETSASYNVSYFNGKNKDILRKYIYCNACEGDGLMVPTKLAFSDVVVLRGESSNAPLCEFVKAESIRPFSGQGGEFIYRPTPDLSPGAMIIIKEGLITVGAAIPYSFKGSFRNTNTLRHDLLAAAREIEEQTKEDADEEFEQTEL